MTAQPRALHLYVYYKVTRQDADACVVASQRVLKQMRERYSTITSLYERADQSSDEITVMETIQLPVLSSEAEKDLIDAYEQLVIEQFAAFKPAIQRHVEKFLAIPIRE